MIGGTGRAKTCPRQAVGMAPVPEPGPQRRSSRRSLPLRTGARGPRRLYNYPRSPTPVTPPQVDAMTARLLLIAGLFALAGCGRGAAPEEKLPPVEVVLPNGFTGPVWVIL